MLYYEPQKEEGVWFMATWIIRIIIFVVKVIGLYMLYGKMHEKQWKAFVPFLDQYALYKAVYSTKAFWIYVIVDILGTALLSLETIPTWALIVAVLCAIAVMVIQCKFAKGFAKSFGKGTLIAVLTFLFPALMYCTAAFSSDYKYIGNNVQK